MNNTSKHKKPAHAGAPVNAGASAHKAEIVRQPPHHAGQQLDNQAVKTEKLAALGLLVSGVAHEINNPNNFILINIEVLAKIWSDLLPVLEEYQSETGNIQASGLGFADIKKEVGKLLYGITIGSERIKKIALELKNFSRDNNESHQQVDINAVVESSLVIVNGLIKSSTSNFNKLLSPSIPLVSGNSQQLEQVVINLLTNSCQALGSKNKAISISTYKQGDTHVVIEVKDEGCGIPREALNDIFKPFYTSKHNSGGTGLGLSISQNIIKKHNGTLSFESTPGNGTTAKIILPSISG